jgi:phytoene desaturase
MRTVRGRSDHVVVIGAGLGGLASALHLLGSGRRVTVLERAEIPGGRAGRLDTAGYRFDTGPTVLTMPALIDESFAAVGEETSQWLTLRRLDPVYRAWFADGSHLDVRSDVDAMSDEIASAIGPDHANGYRSFVDFTRRLYDYEMRDFIDRNIDSPLDVFRPNLARLIAMGGFRRMSRMVGQFMPDQRLQRVFSFQSMYAGMSPFDALALYCVISYMDSVGGVYIPEGGMHALPVAMADAAGKHGAELRYDCEATLIERRGDRAVAVHTSRGERIACDAVVVNADLPTAMRDLLGAEPWSVRRLRSSPSCFLMLVGSSTAYSKTTHHNLHFGRSWRGVFDELISRGELMSDPSFLVSTPTFSDPALAPTGRHSYHVFFPTPNTTAQIDWQSERSRYRDRVVQTLEQRGYVGFAGAVDVEHITDPSDWERMGMRDGSPFSAAHSFWQTGPFRPKNIWGDNIVFAGSGTTPGVGVPMVLVSGRLAAERITGPSATRSAGRFRMPLQREGRPPESHQPPTRYKRPETLRAPSQNSQGLRPPQIPIPPTG